MRPVEGVLIVTVILLMFVQLNLQQFVVFPPGGGGGTPYSGLYGKAPPERGTFFGLQA